MKVNIGKNTLGDSDKMSVSLREYGRSTHRLSSAWRSPMGVGTLVPFMKLVGLPGDTFEIDLDTRIMTHPTVGPLFGNFKFQADVFTCPIRLYNAMLHNNKLQYRDWETDRKSTRLNSSHRSLSRMPSSA